MRPRLLARLRLANLVESLLGFAAMGKNPPPGYDQPSITCLLEQSEAVPDDGHSHVHDATSGHDIQRLRDDSRGSEDWTKDYQSTTILINNPSTTNGPGGHDNERAWRRDAVASAAAEDEDGQENKTTSAAIASKSFQTEQTKN